MFEKPIEFIVRGNEYSTLEKVLEAVSAIKKDHPNAIIRVEVEV